MLAFHPLQEQTVPPARMVEWLQRFRETLLRDGMASMDEYGDMLNWGLPKQDGVGRSLHVFHPDFCSYSDAFYGTVHFHGGWIRGTILAGGLEHHTYEAVPDPDGDRFLDEQPYTLTRHTRQQGAGTSYVLPARVPHWVRPTELTLTLFEEEDNGIMGDLLNPATKETDDQPWTQQQAEALLPQVLALIDERLAALTLTV